MKTAIATLSLTIICSCLPVHGQHHSEFSATVVDVINGDTVTIHDPPRADYCVKLAGISVPDKTVSKAKQLITRLCLQKIVNVKPDMTNTNGKRMGYIQLLDWECTVVNDELVKHGFAKQLPNYNQYTVSSSAYGDNSTSKLTQQLATAAKLPGRIVWKTTKATARVGRNITCAIGTGICQAAQGEADGPCQTGAERGAAVGQYVFRRILAPAVAAFGGPGTAQAGVEMMNAQ